MTTTRVADREAERTVLGSLLLHPDLWPSAAAAGFEPGLFDTDPHRTIAQALIRTGGNGHQDPMLAVRSDLLDRDELGRVGAPYLLKLSDGNLLREPARLQEHLERLRTLAHARAARRVLAEADDLLCRRPSESGAILVAHADRVRELTAQLDTRPSETDPRFETALALAGRTPETPDWLVQPYIARGSITELDARPKAGKTTFVGHAISAILNGHPFLGSATTYTPVVWATEERPQTFREVLRRATLLEHTDLSILSFWNVASLEWPTVADLLERECGRQHAGLLVVDTLGQFARLQGEAENNAGDALLALQPLQRIAATGIAVVVLRHERKSGGQVGESGRGSSAFAGAVDVVLALQRPQGKTRASVRELHALSRFDATPRTLIVERIHSANLSTGSLAETYVSLGTDRAVEGREAREALLKDLPVSEDEALTLKDFLDTHKGLSRGTVQGLLKDLETEERVIKIGEGKRGHPHRYFIADVLSARNPITRLAETNLDTEMTHA